MTNKKTFSIITKGLWNRKNDLEEILQADINFNPLWLSSKTEGLLGWGDKPSSVKARLLAEKRKLPFIRLEDGFLKGWGAGIENPSVSYVVDPVGIYYNASSPSRLENLILDAEDNLSEADLARVQDCISEIVSNKLSKYNNAPIVGLNKLDIGYKKYVLLVDQVKGDQSIKGSMANNASFSKMLLHASEHHPDCEIVIKAHPASGGTKGPLLEAAQKYDIKCKIITDRVNLWPLIENCEHFYTVSSQTGFEALLIDKPVTCFGMPFYAGWGLTNDLLENELRNGKKRHVEQIFKAAYIDYTKYLGLHDRKLTTIENAIDELTYLTKTRRKNGKHFVTVGMSYRKEKALEPLLKGMTHIPFHFKYPTEAIKFAGHWPETKIAVWGQDAMKDEQKSGIPVSRVEDGFIRSVGLGAAFARPYSIVVDNSGHLHFDRRGASDLENLINNFTFKPKNLERAQKLADRIVRDKINKYMLEGVKEELPRPEGKLRILVPGQVEGDASLRYGSPEINTNTALINKVRELYPDALIAFKEHPDVASGLRAGKADTSAADLVVTKHGITDLFQWADRVETMTSLSGFEALIYGLDVGTHGYPFYAGWGFTDDRISDEYKRDRKTLNSFNELLYVAMFEYPIYMHPKSLLPCSPEELLDVLTTLKPTIYQKLKSYILTSIGRAKLKAKK